MKRWQNFFLQAMETGSTMHESVASWGIWCKEIPFKLVDKVKQPAKRTWPDEHGDDEYIGKKGLLFEAYTMKVEFGCKKMSSLTVDGKTIDAVEDVRVKVSSFLEYLRSSGMLRMYSTHNRIGRKNVRFDSFDDDATWKSEDDGSEFLIFKVTLKVNDPKTDVTINNSSLVDVNE